MQGVFAMQTFRRFTKPVSYVVTLGMLAVSLHLPVANAAMIGTEAVVHAVQAQQQRDRIHEVLNREDIKMKLVSLGVEPSRVQARVDALTDDEAQRLAQQLDELPAGGHDHGLSAVLDVALLVFLILLITDLLGLTDVFRSEEHT